MNKNLVSALAAGAIALTASVPALAGDLTGQNIGVTWLFPDASTTYANQVVNVGAGAEITCAGGGAGSGLCVGFADAASFDLGANTISFMITSGKVPWSASAFNGYSFSGLAAGGAWSGYTLSTTFTGLDASRIAFTPDSISVNMQGITPAEGQSFMLTLQANPVPEPETYALLLGGLGLLGFVARRRQS